MTHPLELQPGVSSPLKHKLGIVNEFRVQLENFVAWVTVPVTISKAPKGICSSGRTVVGDYIYIG